MLHIALFIVAVCLFSAVAAINGLFIIKTFYRAYKMSYDYYYKAKEGNTEVFRYIAPELIESNMYTGNITTDHEAEKSIGKHAPPSDDEDNMIKYTSSINMLLAILFVIRYIANYYDQGFYERTDGVKSWYSLWITFGAFIWLLVDTNFFLTRKLTKKPHVQRTITSICFGMAICFLFASISTEGRQYMWIGLSIPFVLGVAFMQIYILRTKQGVTTRRSLTSLFRITSITICTYILASALLLILGPDVSAVIVEDTNYQIGMFVVEISCFVVASSCISKAASDITVSKLKNINAIKVERNRENKRKQPKRKEKKPKRSKEPEFSPDVVTWAEVI